MSAAAEASPIDFMGTNRVHLNRRLGAWFRHNARHFPWRDAVSPFHVTVAEILLRKTRAEDVVPVYWELLSQFPTPAGLARARVSTLRRLVSPLGLRSRGDLLKQLGQELVRRHNGQVPADGPALSQLPGMGRYAACAVLSFAFGKRKPIVDSTIGRLLRRLTGVTGEGHAYLDERLWKIASALLPASGPSVRRHNYALLDFAALVCTRATPRCGFCVLSQVCISHGGGSHGILGSEPFHGRWRAGHRIGGCRGRHPRVC